MDFCITSLMEGYIDDEFWPEERSLSAERIRRLTMEKIGTAPARKMPKWGRSLLIAAVISLVLATTALAAYQHFFRDAVIEEELTAYIGGDGEAIERGEVLSLLGYQDTPQYQAFVEWNNYSIAYYNANYDTLEDDSGMPNRYLRYGAFNAEMAAKLDEIVAAHGLVLHDDGFYIFDSEEEAYQVLGSADFLLGENLYVTGYAYSDGTFNMENALLFGEKTIDYSIFSSVDGTFTNISASADNMGEDYEQWRYVTANGTEAELVLGEHESLILAELDHAYMTVMVDGGTKGAPEERNRLAYDEENYVLSRQELEGIADAIDFSVISGIGEIG